MYCKLLVIAALFMSSVASAATHYVDRYVPTSICMIQVEGRSVNAGAIAYIDAGTWKTEGNVLRKDEVFSGIKIHLVNRLALLFPSDRPEDYRTKIINQIKSECERK